MQTARVIVRNGDGLDLLKTATSNGRTTLTGLPSWVPDWSSNTGEIRGWIDADQAIAPQLYRAGSSRSSSVKLYQDPNSLFTILGMDVGDDEGCIAALGGYIDTISEVTQDFSFTETDEYLRIEQMLGWWNECQEVVADWATYPTGETRFSALWRTVIANQTHNHVRPTLEYEHHAKAFILLHSLVEYVRGRDKETPPIWDTYRNALAQNNAMMIPLKQQTTTENIFIPVSAVRFQQAFNDACRGRRFCVIRKGYTALVPPETRIGDTFCVFAGAQLPFVLRAKEDMQSYEAIGRCYIHGVFDGGVWAWNDFELKEIIIS